MLFRSVRGRWPAVDVATAFFPFLSAYTCLQWGLPLSRLRPRQLVQRAVATVRPGGWLVVVNQTSAERAELARLLADQPIVPGEAPLPSTDREIDDDAAEAG